MLNRWILRMWLTLESYAPTRHILMNMIWINSIVKYIYKTSLINHWLFDCSKLNQQAIVVLLAWVEYYHTKQLELERQNNNVNYELNWIWIKSESKLLKKQTNLENVRVGELMRKKIMKLFYKLNRIKST